jgi:hypothetical protein
VVFPKRLSSEIELMINLKVGNALGLTPAQLAREDELIE